MKPRVGKGKSKRISCRQRYKVERKVKEHHRKLRRQGKDERLDGPKLKKDLGVPNLHPFKEALLKSAEATKERIKQEKERQKIERRKLATKQRTLEALQADAMRRGEKFEAHESGEALRTMPGVNENSRRAFYKEFKKVVDAADVILEVLDARDPLGCRCPRVEQAVLESGGRKKLVLVLNKIDLVPREVVEQWLVYLRKEFPTIAFKASTQGQKDHLAQSSDSLSAEGGGSRGANMLLSLLANYCRNANIKTGIRVGIVGFPNVGKSSLINSLKRSRACAVAPTPGFTRSMQEVVLDKHVKLLDSPGIVFAKNASDVDLVLRNVVKLDSLPDPTAPVEAILSRCNREQIMLRYVLPEFTTTLEFLQHLARRQGRLKRGGIPDTEAAARILLQDWIDGRLSYYTVPPAEHAMPAHLATSVVGEMSAAFDIATLMQDEDRILESIPLAHQREGLIAMTASEMTTDLAGLSDEEEDDEDYHDDDDDDDDEYEDEEGEQMEGDSDLEDGEEMDDDDEEEAMEDEPAPARPAPVMQTTVKPRQTAVVVPVKKAELYDEASGEMLQRNKGKKEFKKMKRAARKAALSEGGDEDGAAEDTGAAAAAADETDEYNFATDFVDIGDD